MGLRLRRRVWRWWRTFPAGNPPVNVRLIRPDKVVVPVDLTFDGISGFEERWRVVVPFDGPLCGLLVDELPPGTAILITRRS